MEQKSSLWTDLLDVAKNIKVAVGPKSQINQLEGASYNSLMAPVHERDENARMTDMLIGLNEQQGQDMTAFKLYRDDARKARRPVGAPVMKILGEMAMQGMKGERPMGQAFAERLIPGTPSTPLPPEVQGPPAPPTVTPQQQALRDLVARGKPDTLLKDLPTVMDYAQSGGGETGGAAFFETFFAAYPTLDTSQRQLLRNAPGGLWRTAEGRYKLMAQADKWSKENDAQQRQAAQDTTQAGNTTYQRTRDAQGDKERAERERLASIQHHQNLIHQSTLPPPQKSQAMAAVGKARSPEEAQQIFTQVAGQIPASKPLDKAGVVKEFQDNSYHIAMMSKYQRGESSQSELATGLAQLGLGNSTPPPNPELAGQHIRFLLDKQQELITAMMAFDPQYATAMQRQLDQMRAAVGIAPAEAAAPEAPAAPGKTVAPGAMVQDFRTAIAGALTKQGNGVMPAETSPAYQAVLNDAFAAMLAKGYERTEVLSRMQKVYPQWRPVSPPSR